MPFSPLYSIVIIILNCTFIARGGVGPGGASSARTGRAGGHGPKGTRPGSEERGFSGTPWSMAPGPVLFRYAVGRGPKIGPKSSEFFHTNKVISDHAHQPLASFNVCLIERKIQIKERKMFSPYIAERRFTWR